MEHSPVGPSAAHRWMACPGSVELNEKYDDVETAYSKEGTLAHEVAEYRLRGHTGQLKKGEQPVHATDQVMSDYVDEYVNYILAELNRCAAKDGGVPKLIIEEKITLDTVDERLFGTVDAMFHCKTEMRTYVFDLKYGKGVWVDVEDNPQLMFYALGAYHHNFPRTVKIHVIQPRLENIDFMLYTAVQMEAFEEKLSKALYQVDHNSEAFVQGDKQCKFCKAKGECPALATKYVAMLTDKHPFEIDLPKGGLSPKELGKIYSEKKGIAEFLTGVEKAVLRYLLEGTEVPGCKLVASNGGGVWKDTKGKEGRYVNNSTNCCTPSKLLEFPKLWEEKCELELVAVPDTDKRAPVRIKPLELPAIEEK